MLLFQREDSQLEKQKTKNKKSPNQTPNLTKFSAERNFDPFGGRIVFKRLVICDRSKETYTFANTNEMSLKSVYLQYGYGKVL